MTITAVATVPKSIQLPASDAPVDADAQASGLDFANMLFGQLTQSAEKATGEASLSRAASEQLASEIEEEDQPNDALALLAALNAPVVPRNDASATSTTNAGLAQSVGESALQPTAGEAVLKPAAGQISLQTTVGESDLQPAAGQTSLQPAAGEAILQPADGKTSLTAPWNNSPGATTSDLLKESMTDEFATNPTSRQPPATFAVPLDLASKDGTSSSTQQASETSQPAPTAPISHPAIATLTGHTALASRDTETLPISSPLHHPHWNNDFSQKIVWLASNQKQVAELTLNPPNMGSIEVSLRIDNDQATATFVSTNADVRESIETALPRLREMLAGAGISLGQTNVSAESFRQASGQGSESHGASPAGTDNAILADVSRDGAVNARFLTANGRGLVDLFA